MTDFGWIAETHRRSMAFDETIAEGPPNQLDVQRMELSGSQAQVVLSGFCGPWRAREAAQNKLSVEICTDGSLKTVEPDGVVMVSWAFVLIDQWLRDTFRNVPREDQLKAFRIEQNLVCRSGVLSDLDPSQLSIFDGELAAIVFALAAVPANWNVMIHADSESAIKAVRRFHEEASERRRLRCEGRPFLRHINSFMDAHKQCGTQVVFRHVASHSDAMTLASAGNRCADYLAKKALDKAKQRQRGIQEISRLSARSGSGSSSSSRHSLSVDAIDKHGSVSAILQQGERFVTFRNDSGYVVYGDVRRQAARRARERCLERWCGEASGRQLPGPGVKTGPKEKKKQGASSRVGSQARLACSGARAAVRRLVQWRSSVDVALFLRCITDMLERDSSGKQATVCSICNVLQTVSHVLLECSALRAARRQLVEDVCVLLENKAAARGLDWMRSSRIREADNPQVMLMLLTSDVMQEKVATEQALLGAMDERKLAQAMVKTVGGAMEKNARVELATALLLRCWDWAFW